VHVPSHPRGLLWRGLASFAKEPYKRDYILQKTPTVPSHPRGLLWRALAWHYESFSKISSVST